jgi:hypothetical protein
MTVEMLPRDAHNAELVANVHPPDWRQPSPAPRYNLVVIGGGTAGLVTGRAPPVSARAWLSSSGTSWGATVSTSAACPPRLLSGRRGWSVISAPHQRSASG